MLCLLITGNSGASVRPVARRRGLRLRHVSGRGAMGRAADAAGRELSEDTVGSHAARVAEAMRDGVHQRRGPIRVSAVYNVVALRRAEDHRPLLELRAVDTPGHRSSREPLDQAGTGAALPTGRLIRLLKLNA